ncbi:hypothetical protein L227DRAFT_200877 [Lentinus tigrinus ALCF2SS1-6]|uniref:Uncharacterized protein n=1 Tax=Lentinus tigrinus ALCF2SS1-6 TaxID=1328759 RepID=A0A5C2S386_9APHY|nr:hypothetical protein L227DRAFT_200877 [Lentinus tigrinus ALCF2SS1-6]
MLQIPSYDDVPFNLPFPMPSQFVVPTDLPAPTSLWCRYGAWPVASTLRPADPVNGLAPDMVMPMSPNTQYLKGRPTLSPQDPFPFRNCFFWACSSTRFRVKVRKEGYDDSQAIRLTIKDHCNLLSSFDFENSRMMEIATEYNATHPAVSPEAGDSIVENRVIVEGSHSSLRSPSFSDESLPSPSISDSEDESAEDYRSHSASSSVDDLRDYNLFGWDPDPSVLFLPLVDVWFELKDHLEEGDIPSPLEFYEEEAAIKSTSEESGSRHRPALLPGTCESRRSGGCITSGVDGWPGV